MDWLRQSLVFMELKTLRSFLAQVESFSSAEIARRDDEVRSWTSWDVDDLSNAVMEPFGWLRIGVGAVYHELAALVENEIQRAAHPGWVEKRARSRPAAPFKDDEFTAEFKEWAEKEVADVGFGKLVGLIEGYHRLRLRDIRGANTVERLREVVNDLKHRKGRVDTRRRSDAHLPVLSEHQLEIEKAGEAIVATGEFLTELWARTQPN